jgi:hypothetical protein
MHFAASLARSIVASWKKADDKLNMIARPVNLLVAARIAAELPQTLVA